MEEQALNGERRKQRRWLKPLVEPSFWLAIGGWISLALFPAYCNLLWILAILFGAIRLLRAARAPRKRLWFFDGAGEISLSVAGLLLLGSLIWPRWLRAEVPPLDYVDKPLNEVLEDFCVHAETQDYFPFPMFTIHEQELKVRKVTLRTSRPMTLLKALRKLTRSARCSFHRGGVASKDPFTTVYRDHCIPRQGETTWLITGGFTFRYGEEDFKKQREAENKQAPEPPK